jgi:IS1 family transposase
MSWSLLPRELSPPATREIQLDEKWSFVGKKEAHSDPADPLDRFRGDDWDHTAVDAESRLLLSLVPGKRTAENCDNVVQDLKMRTAGRTDLLITSDEHGPYSTAIEKAYAVEVPQPKAPGPGRPPGPKRQLPSDLCYASVQKTRAKGRVVNVVRTLVFGTTAYLSALLSRSRVSSTVNTSFVERNNGTDRRQNSRKVRKTCGFSKDWELHNAASYFIGFSYNFCWPVRTLRIRSADGRWQPRTPAMASGLADHRWTTDEWVTYPARGP